MSLEENSIELTRKLQQAGTNLVRLSRYAANGITPSHENFRKAADYFEHVSRTLDPVLRDSEQQVATQRMRGLSMRG